MRTTRRSFVALAASALAAQEEFFDIYRDPPRLFLTPQRLRRLRRDRERRVGRWAQFEALVRGGAPMTEPGFALALYSQVARDEEAARKAVAWAATADDARQIALVYDWCVPHSEALKPRLEEAHRRSRIRAQRRLLRSRWATVRDSPASCGDGGAAKWRLP